MKKTFNSISKSIILIVFAMFTMMACNEMEQDPIVLESFPEKVAFVRSNVNNNGMNLRTHVCNEETYQMLAGQKVLDYGSYKVFNDDEYVHFTISTSGDWFITEAHLTYGDNYKTMKGVSRNNVAPGQFIMKEHFNPAVQEHTFSVLIENINMDNFHFAFHGAVVLLDEDGLVLQGETSYSYGERIHERGVWATYSKYIIMKCDDDDDDDDEVCGKNETAYAGILGESTDGGNNGWWYYIDTHSDSNVYPIYAGQKLTDGTVTVKDNVIYIDLGSWSLQDKSESVKILGYNELPTNRPASGKSDDRIYAGNELEVNVDTFRYYVVHLDAHGCVFLD